MNRSFSVIIPTRERADTLEASLRSVCTQKYENLEIIVSDNFSGDTTRDVVASFNDRRIKYVNTGERLNMSANWDFALSHVTNDWVTIVGDDDALMPDCFPRVNVLVDETGVDAVRSLNCFYRWPNEIGKGSGRLYVPLATGNEIRDCRAWRQRLLTGQAIYKELPMLYTGGFVKMSAVRQATRGDRFYRSCIPDVFSALAFSTTLDRYAYTHEPLAVGGTSRHSTGAAYSSTAKQNGEVESPAKRFLSEGNIPFHPSIPTDDVQCRAPVQALVYESAAQVAELFPQITLPTVQTQLRRILETTKPGNRRIETWARRFAELHDLPYDDVAKACASSRKWRHRIRRIKTRLERLADFDNRTFPTMVGDVYEASLVANEVIRDRRHWVVRLARGTGKRVARRFTSRSSR